MFQQKLIVAAIIIILGGGAAAYVIHGNQDVAVVPPSAPLAPYVPPTPAWYEAHQDALTADNKRCDDEGANAPPGMCMNVDIADKEVSDDNALKMLNQTSSSGK